jgi:hypothetical protein
VGSTSCRYAILIQLVDSCVVRLNSSTSVKHIRRLAGVQWDEVRLVGVRSHESLSLRSNPHTYRPTLTTPICETIVNPA